VITVFQRSKIETFLYTTDIGNAGHIKRWPWVDKLPHNGVGHGKVNDDPFLWPPCGIGKGRPLYCRPVVSSLFFFYLFSSPILSRRILDVYYTSTHGVALVRI